MPELVEVEYYRRLAERAVGRRIDRVDAPDAWFLKAGLTAEQLAEAVTGRRIAAARRIGKLLLLDTDEPGPTLGLRFGMTGRIVVDGVFGLDDLEYGSARDEPQWDRVTFHLADGGDLRIRDPRRLGGVLLDPDEISLGVDAREATLGDLRRALGGSTMPVKARLLAQDRIAGIGNLLGDEVLYRAALDPAREAGSLDDAELRRLHRHLRATVEDLLVRGGSHTGHLQPERRAGGACPKDGTPLVRRTIGGRTSWSCPTHQR